MNPIYRSTQIYKDNLGGLQEKYRHQHIILGDFNIPLSKMDGSSKRNINKAIAALKNALDQMDFTETYRAFHTKEAKYTFFLNAHGTFSETDHMTGGKTSLNKFKKIEIISSMTTRD